jgi:multidrug efflux pump subunit AcrA (membrane-fusion protein)
MRRLLLILTAITFSSATDIKIDRDEMDKWGIKTERLTLSKTIPLGDFVAEVTIPPQLLYSLTLPFTAQVLQVDVANYERIKKGQLIAKVTGQEWIEIQKQFIEDSIELKHHKNVAKRKNHLCKEEIIPKKECNSANAEYKADMIKVDASKALLKSYGATKSMIDGLFNRLKISRTIPIFAKKSGTIIELNMRVGKTIEPSEALMVVKKSGNLWLEAELPLDKAKFLEDGEEIILTFRNKKFSSKVLQHAPIINVQNQTQKVKFLLPSSLKLLAGLRDTVSIEIRDKALQVTKSSIIHSDSSEVIFIRTQDGFKAVDISVIAQDSIFYYIEDNPILRGEVATSSIAILKSLMESEDE